MGQPLSKSRLFGATFGALALIAATTSCGAISDALSGNDAKRDEPGGQITESAQADVFSLTAGDCVNAADMSGMVSEVEAMPCTDPHDAQIIAEYEYPKGDYPGDDEFATKAETFCVDEFATFVGISYDESEFELGPLTPTEQSWKMGDRVLQCVVISAEPITTSFEGLAQ